MVDIFAEYLDEPNCIFGKENEEKDPKLGLKYFGPYYSKSEKKPIARIDVGVVGDSHTITFTKRILKILLCGLSISG